MDVQEEKTYDFVAENLALNFANTAGALKTDTIREYITGYRDLVAWGKQAGVLQPEAAEKLLREALQEPEKAEAVRLEAVRLRGVLRSIFVPVSEGKKVPTEALERFNGMLSDAMRHACLERDAHGHFEWGWEGLDKSFNGLLWPVVRAAADLLVAGDLSRVGICASETCGWLFLDTTRNHSRQWCDMRDCGNRAKARRHYHRKKAGGE
jgi:predicted RNA-binding Zn ribbon-like protein